MKRVLIVANNVTGNDDGIGKHARIVAEELKKRKDIASVCIEHGQTLGMSKIKKTISLQMTKALFRANQAVLANQCDIVVAEYPFAEFNPLILPAYRRLHESCKKKKITLILSLHEYDRVNGLRKAAIRYLLKNSDAVFVSEDKYRNSLKQYNNNIFVRRIPNHINPPEDKKIIDKNKFVYFGLINKSKAFDRMLEAWDEFNKNSECHLDIISATEINFNKSLHRNVDYYCGLDNAAAAEMMFKACFAVIPVLPQIGYNNSSFVSCIQCGCIPVGHFDEKLKGLDFVLNIEDYQLRPFVSGLQNCMKYSVDELESMSDKAVNFGAEFSIEATVNQMIMHF